MLLSRSYVLKHIVTADRLGRHPGFCYLKQPGMHLLYCIERFSTAQSNQKRMNAWSPPNAQLLTLLYQLRQGWTTSGSSIPCSSMYQMLKLKLGPQDIRGTVAQERSTVAYNSGSNNNHHQHYLTDFDKSARKHLLVNLVLQGKRFLVVVIFKATARTEKKNPFLKASLNL